MEFKHKPADLLSFALFFKGRIFDDISTPNGEISGLKQVYWFSLFIALFPNKKIK